MTSRQVFEHSLSELNKVKAPSLLLEDFVYFFNKTVIQYVNSIYNSYGMSQERDDNLRVLKATAELTPTQSGSKYEVNLPDDYLHILNCEIEYQVNSQSYCNIPSTVRFGVKRKSSDSKPQLTHNYYFKPAYNNPYFDINNVNVSNVFPTEEGKEEIDSNIRNKIGGLRYGNVTKVRMELDLGKPNQRYQLSKVYVDYLKVPQYISLSQDELDDVEDQSQILEFPDYVCNEIINLLVSILLENSGNPRLQSHNPINQSIGNPAQTNR